MEPRSGPGENCQIMSPHNSAGCMLKKVRPDSSHSTKRCTPRYRAYLVSPQNDMIMSCWQVPICCHCMLPAHSTCLKDEVTGRWTCGGGGEEKGRWHRTVSSNTCFWRQGCLSASPLSRLYLPCPSRTCRGSMGELMHDPCKEAGTA